MVKKHIGRQAFFRGKSLFELCCNIKNFGANRIVYRNNQNTDLLEKSFYRLTRVEPDMESLLTRGKAWGEKVHRGHWYGIRRIDAGYKTDWVLVPKDEENLYQVHHTEPPKKTIPAIDMPPIWKMILQQKNLTDNKDHTSQN